MSGNHLLTSRLSAVVGPTLPPAEFSAFLAAATQIPHPCIRVRPQTPTTELPFSTRPVPWEPRGRWLDAAVRPGSFVEFGAGNYYIQDASSMLAVAALAAQPGEWVLDLCAAPGGKSTAILESLGGSGWLLANESVRSRVPLLVANLARHGSTRYVVSNHDPTSLVGRVGAIFDAVLVDAPCSAQSLMGRDKQTERAFGDAMIDHCAARQERILAAATQFVKPGGRLIYSTCTFSFAENEQQVLRLLEVNSEWESVDIPRLAAWKSIAAPGCYRLWPHRDDGNGTFVAALRRRDGSLENIPAKRIRGAQLPREVTEWGRLGSGFALQQGQQVFAWPDAPPDALLDVFTHGPEVAFQKASTWFPSYALAMRRDNDWQPGQCLALSREDACRFLVGNELTLSEDHHSGWVTAMHRDAPLGWVKITGRRAKNHLPKSLRLVGVR